MQQFLIKFQLEFHGNRGNNLTLPERLWGKFVKFWDDSSASNLFMTTRKSWETYTIFVSERVTVFTECAEGISFMALRWFRLNRYAYLAQY